MRVNKYIVMQSRYMTTRLPFNPFLAIGTFRHHYFDVVVDCGTFCTMLCGLVAYYL